MAVEFQLDDGLAQRVIAEDWRVMFHGTCRRFDAFTEESIGKGGDDNSSLGVHLAEFPDTAAEYADAGHLRGEGEATVLVVLVPARHAFEVRHYETFFGFNEEGNPDPNVGHAGFARWRQQLLAQGHDAVDYEDGEGCITVALDPASLQIVGRMDVKDAFALREAMDELGDVFDPQARIGLLQALNRPTAPVGQLPVRKPFGLR